MKQTKKQTCLINIKKLSESPGEIGSFTCQYPSRGCGLLYQTTPIVLSNILEGVGRTTEEKDIIAEGFGPDKQKH